ncbi:response regulator [filamentous cyanobacterium LEGE 11480]|uniref:Response regulator n=1 Tax=Romeriopsis navalis LEGE 11480 TaxID=2777977 RepID=A0A928VQ55_9CYAN|nr:response regulator [Romeriopsis navalis]MBE9031763.1 response regulator [Romeriopsis navalis LEGE 11480]
MLTAVDKSLFVIEDSDEDFEILKIFIEDMDITNPIYRCETGDRALDMFYQEGDYKDVEPLPHPSVILLDLNLPGTDGREVLGLLKGDQRFRDIPIVVFSTSSDPADINLCYEKGANGYLVKPVATDELEKIVQSFAEFWLNINTPPQLT